MATDRVSTLQSDLTSADVLDTAVFGEVADYDHLTTSKDGKRKHDTTDVPFIRPMADIWDTTTCSKNGPLYQMEGTILNVGKSNEKLSGLRMDIEPPGCVTSYWNMKPINDDDPGKTSFGLCGWWTEARWEGGVPPGAAFSWGAIFTTDTFEITYRTYAPIK